MTPLFFKQFDGTTFQLDFTVDQVELPLYQLRKLIVKKLSLTHPEDFGFGLESFSGEDNVEHIAWQKSSEPLALSLRTKNVIFKRITFEGALALCRKAIRDSGPSSGYTEASAAVLPSGRSNDRNGGGSPSISASAGHAPALLASIDAAISPPASTVGVGNVFTPGRRRCTHVGLAERNAGWRRLGALLKRTDSEEKEDEDLETDFTKMAAIESFYRELHHSVTCSESIIVSPDEAVRLAAAFCQAEFGDCNEERSAYPFYKKYARKILPREHCASVKHLWKKILPQYMMLKGFSPARAQRFYLEAFVCCDYFGTVFFRVKSKHKKAKGKQVLLGINSSSVLQVDVSTKKLQIEMPLLWLKDFTFWEGKGISLTFKHKSQRDSKYQKETEREGDSAVLVYATPQMDAIAFFLHEFSLRRQLAAEQAARNEANLVPDSAVPGVSIESPAIDPTNIHARVGGRRHTVFTTSVTGDQLWVDEERQERGLSMCEYSSSEHEQTDCEEAERKKTHVEHREDAGNLDLQLVATPVDDDDDTPGARRNIQGNQAETDKHLSESKTRGQSGANNKTPDGVKGLLAQGRPKKEGAEVPRPSKKGTAASVASETAASGVFPHTIKSQINHKEPKESKRGDEGRATQAVDRGQMGKGQEVQQKDKQAQPTSPRKEKKSNKNKGKEEEKSTPVSPKHRRKGSKGVQQLKKLRFMDKTKWGAKTDKKQNGRGGFLQGTKQKEKKQGADKDKKQKTPKWPRNRAATTSPQKLSAESGILNNTRDNIGKEECLPVSKRECKSDSKSFTRDGQPAKMATLSRSGKREPPSAVLPLLKSPSKLDSSGAVSSESEHDGIASVGQVMKEQKALEKKTAQAKGKSDAKANFKREALREGENSNKKKEEKNQESGTDNNQSERERPGSPVCVTPPVTLGSKSSPGSSSSADTKVSMKTQSGSVPPSHARRSNPVERQPLESAPLSMTKGKTQVKTKQPLAISEDKREKNSEARKQESADASTGVERLLHSKDNRRGDDSQSEARQRMIEAKAAQLEKMDVQKLLSAATRLASEDKVRQKLIEMILTHSSFET